MTTPVSTRDNAGSTVAQAIAAGLDRHVPSGAPLCVAFSGGLDSSVLLHALPSVAGSRPLRAIHIDHNLQPQSGEWAAGCMAICAANDIPAKTLPVVVDLAAGKGLEAAAREARYAAFAADLTADEVLLTAHHQRDQLETLLLQLFRGAGVHGLAAMPPFGRRDDLALLRPLLSVPAETIARYGREFGLAWIEDPSNSELDLDRNYLRHQLVPLLVSRWQAVERSVERSARLCAEAAEVLDEVAAADLAGVQDGNRLSVAGLLELPDSRRRNAFRCALRRLGLAVPSEKQLRGAISMLADARADAQPEVMWPGVSVRRYRGHLWLFAADEDPGALPISSRVIDWEPSAELDLGKVRGIIGAQSCMGEGIADRFFGGALSVRFRRGGEKFRPGHKMSTRQLKNLLQETDVVPWMRGHIPLICSGNELLAIGDLWINQDFAAAAGEPGWKIIWRDHSVIR